MSKHGLEPQPPRREGLLLLTALGTAVLVVSLSWALALQFVDARHASAAREIAAGDGGPHQVVEVRQRIDPGNHGPSIGRQVADYQTDSGDVATVEVHGWDESDLASHALGWVVVPGGAGGQVFVTADGTYGMLDTDYEGALAGQFDAVHRLVDGWIVGWSLLGLTMLGIRAAGQMRRGATSAVRAARAPACYLLGLGVLVALAWAAAIPLSAHT